MTCSCNNNAVISVRGNAQTLAQGDLITFTQNASSGTGLNYSGSNVNITKSGVYLVSFNATATSGTANTTVTLQLYRNGVAVPTGIASFTPTSTTSAQSFGVTTFVTVDNVCPCSGGVSEIPLTLVNTGTGATYSIVEMTVARL